MEAILGLWLGRLKRTCQNGHLSITNLLQGGTHTHTGINQYTIITCNHVHVHVLDSACTRQCMY